MSPCTTTSLCFLLCCLSQGTPVTAGAHSALQAAALPGRKHIACALPKINWQINKNAQTSQKVQRLLSNCQVCSLQLSRCPG